VNINYCSRSSKHIDLAYAYRWNWLLETANRHVCVVTESPRLLNYPTDEILSMCCQCATDWNFNHTLQDAQKAYKTTKL